MQNEVSYARHVRVGVIRIDNPPVNALGQAVRQGLLDALREALDDDLAEVLVLLAAGRTFIAGADIREFGKPPQAPLLPDVIKSLEMSAKPLIAVLHGTALGGGLEVALGCHWRIALEGTRVGLPEVKLGLLPGAGGTQRLPRLAGIDCALDMITSGRFVDTDEALANGIVDDVVAGADPLQAGLVAAGQVLEGRIAPRATSELPAPSRALDVCARYRQQLTLDVPYLFSPFRCVDAIEAASRLSFSEGLERERELFRECMDSPQRGGMIHAFFAARGTHKVPGADAEIPLTTLGLVGEHALFEALSSAATKADVHLVRFAGVTSDEAVEACLVAPDVDDCRRQAIRDALPANTPWIDMATRQGTPDALPAQPGDATLMLSPLGASQAICELVDLTGNPALIQALANTLKQLKRQVVVTRDESVIATLDEALTRTLADAGNDQRRSVVAWRAEGWDLSPWLAVDGATESATESAGDDMARYRRPLDLAWQQTATALADAGRVHRDSDIDVLAIHAFGYPPHLGGPRFRALASG